MLIKGRKFEFGDFLLDSKEKTLRRAGKPLAVTPKAFGLLLVLVENHGRLVEKTALMNAVWAESFVEENNLAFTIGLLRRALGDDARKPRFIETVSKRGYRFIAEVTQIDQPAQKNRESDFAENNAPIAPPQFSNAVASRGYDDYLRGRFYAHRQNRDDNDAAIRALERAVAADPTLAPAYAELSQAYVWKLFLFAPGERQWQEKAFVAAEKALSLDPGLAVAYVARGRLLWTPANHFPHEKAIREYRRALSLDPNLDEARNQLALVYNHIGAFDESLAESQKAMTANPNNNLAQFRIAETLNFQEKFEPALAVLRSLPKEINPALVGHQTIWALYNLGRKTEAAAALEPLLRNYPEDQGGLFTSLQALLAASAGRDCEAEALIEAAIEKGSGYGHFHHAAYQIACACALLGKPDRAVEWLETAAADGFPCYPLFKRDANLDNLRTHPRFRNFLEAQRRQWEHFKSVL